MFNMQHILSIYLYSIFQIPFYDHILYLCLTENIDINRHEIHADRNMNVFKRLLTNLWMKDPWIIEIIIYVVENNDSFPENISSVHKYRCLHLFSNSRESFFNYGYYCLQFLAGVNTSWSFLFPILAFKRKMLAYMSHFEEFSIAIDSEGLPERKKLQSWYSHFMINLLKPLKYVWKILESVIIYQYACVCQSSASFFQVQLI